MGSRAGGTGALEIHLERAGEGWRVERIRVECPNGTCYVRRRLEHWRSNALTDVLAGVLATLQLAEGVAVLRADDGEAERRLCARFYDLWHSPGKRVETHWLHDLFAEHPLWSRGYTPLENILRKSGARRRLQIRLAEDFSRDQLQFLEKDRPMAEDRLREFVRERFGLGVSDQDTRVAHNLPRYRTAFFGREKELADLDATLGQVPLVSLVGPGGSGKTRLAVEWARGKTADFAGGVWFLDFSSEREGVDLAASAFRALEGLMSGGAAAPPQPTAAALAAALGRAPCLLLLDNCEYVLRECGDLAAELLDAAPSVHMLATSHERLGLTGERTFRVLPFEVVSDSRPAGVRRLLRSEAVRLFFDRAEAAGTIIKRSRENVEGIARICRLVGGLPLCIEIAATEARHLPLVDLERELAGQAEHLAASVRPIPARHRSVQVLFDWSAGRLSPAERTLLGRLSVFRGGWSLDSMSSVCRDDRTDEAELRRLHDRLIDKSVIEIDPRSRRRFRMLEPIRQCAAALPTPEEAAECRRRHFAYFLSLAEDVASVRGTRPAVDADSRMDSEEENLAEALDGAIERGDPRAARFVLLLSDRWLRRGRWNHGRKAVERILAQGGETEAMFFNVAGQFAFFHADFAQAEAYFERCLDQARLCGDRNCEAHAHMGLGNTAYRRGALDRAGGSYEEALSRWTALGDKARQLAVMNNLAAIAAIQHDYEHAAARFRDVLALAEELGKERVVANVLMNLGLISWNRKEFELADAYYRRSLKEWQHAGDPAGEAMSWSNLGILERDRGRHEQALDCQARSLEIRQRLDDLPGIATCLENVAGVVLDLGHAVRCVRLLAAAARIRKATGAVLLPDEQMTAQADLGKAREALGEARFSTECAVGELMSDRDAATYAEQSMSAARTGSAPRSSRPGTRST